MFLLLKGRKRNNSKFWKKSHLPSKMHWQNWTECFMKRVHCGRLIQKSTYCTAKWLVHFPALPNARLYTYYLVKVHCILKKVIIFSYSCVCEVGTSKYNTAIIDSLTFAIIFVKFLVNFVEFAIMLFILTFEYVTLKHTITHKP